MQNWKKGYVFGHIDKFWNGHDVLIEKNACKNAYLGSIFIPEKIRVKGVFLKVLLPRMISSLKYKWPPGQPLSYHGYSVSGSSNQQCGGIPLKRLCLFSSILVHHKNFSRQSVIKVPNQ